MMDPPVIVIFKGMFRYGRMDDRLNIITFLLPQETFDIVCNACRLLCYINENRDLFLLHTFVFNTEASTQLPRLFYIG